MTAMQIDRAVVEQALDSINELFAAEQSEGGERGGHIRTPATREHLVRVAQARKALHESCGALRAALAQQAEPLNLADPAVRKRLAAQWGYVPAAQAEPVAWRCACGANLYLDEYGHPASRAVPVSYGQTLEEAMRETREKAQAYEAGWKAALAQRAEPAQEPVAWRWGYRSVTTGEMDWRGYVEIAAHPNLRSPEIIIEPLYTAPPQRKPLTEGEIMHIGMTHQSLRQVVRAVERAHGIKEN